MKLSTFLYPSSLTQSAAHLFSTVTQPVLDSYFIQQVNAYYQPLMEWFAQKEDGTVFFIKAQEEKAFQQFQEWRSQFKRELKNLRRLIIHSYRQGKRISPDGIQDTLLAASHAYSVEAFSPLYYIASLKHLAKQAPAYAHMLEGAVIHYQDMLSAHPQKALQHFYQDLINHLVLVAGNQLTVTKLLKALLFYQTLVPASLYQLIEKLLESLKLIQDKARQQDPVLGSMPTAVMTTLIQQINQAFKPLISPSHAEQSSVDLLTRLPSVTKQLVAYAKQQPFKAAAIATAATATLAYYTAGDTANRSAKELFSLPLSYGLSPGFSVLSQMAVSYSLSQLNFLPSTVPKLGLLAGLSAFVPAVQAEIEQPLVSHSKRSVNTEFQINTYTQLDQERVAITGLSNGNFVATWNSGGQDGSGLGVYGQLLDASGTKIGNEFRVNTNIAGDQYSPQVAGLNNGNFIVTWSNNNVGASSVADVYAQLFDASAAKIGSEFLVNTYTTNAQSVSAVTSLGSDKFVIVWVSYGQDSSQNGVYGQVFSLTGSKLGSEFQANSYITNYQDLPAVTSLTNGNFVTTWWSLGQDGSGRGTYGQIFDSSGNRVGSEFQINTYTTNNQGDAAVTSLNNGNFVVTWTSYEDSNGNGQDGNKNGVYAQLFNSLADKVGNELQVNTHTAGSQDEPAVASLNNGNFVIVWNSGSQDGSDFGIYGQVFDSSGNKIGCEFPINMYTTSTQHFPAVASLTNGNFVVTWSSLGQDGSGYGVFGQVFSVSDPLQATNVNQVVTYTEDTAQSLTPVVISTSQYLCVTAELTLSVPSAGNLSATPVSQVTTSFNSANGLWRAVGIVNQINTLLTSVSFIPAANYNSNFNIGISISDGYSTSINGVISVQGIPVNDPPVLTSNTASTLNYQAGEKALVLDNALTLSDVDSVTLASASVAITDNFQAEADILSFSNQAVIQANYNSQTGILSVLNSASIADYQTLLRSISYQNLVSNPSLGARTIQFTVNDGLTNSNTVSYRVNVSPVNNKASSLNWIPILAGASAGVVALGSVAGLLACWQKRRRLNARNEIKEVPLEDIHNDKASPILSPTDVVITSTVANADNRESVLPEQSSHSISNPSTATHSGSAIVASEAYQPGSEVFAQNKVTQRPRHPGTMQINFNIQYTDLKFEQELGRGGYGVVYKGNWRHTSVAVKQLHLQQVSPDVMQEFEREMKIMANLRSPYTVQLYGICIELAPYCMVMEYMNKGSLYQVLHSDVPLSWPLREQIANDIASGLSYLHSQHILHRDLKSLNVLLNENFKAKLCDFGLSKVKTESSATTKGQNTVGTLAWMAPELIEGKPYTQKADVYSYGMVLWELAARERPYKDVPNQYAIPILASQNKHDEIPQETPPKLAKLIRFCWAVKPENRPTANDAVQALKVADAELETTTSQPPEYYSKLNSGPSYISNTASMKLQP